ncbi:MAG TPA: 4-alpha-glucanotransferase, partial [Gammaproteobacteria bacterium]|nr:4-alpha-glucanotransferase [Gammaproteobacteria bacterium]
VVEDLGYITAKVDALRESFQLPSMRVIQFGFDGSDDNPHAAANIQENTVVYTGTHDNDTVISWFDSLHPEAQAFIRERLNLQDNESILDAMIRTTLSSPAALAILPMQDVIGLGAGNRMNKPGTIEDNWTWQFHWDQIPEDLATRFRQKLAETDRL